MDKTGHPLIRGHSHSLDITISDVTLTPTPQLRPEPTKLEDKIKRAKDELEKTRARIKALDAEDEALWVRWKEIKEERKQLVFYEKSDYKTWDMLDRKTPEGKLRYLKDSRLDALIRLDNQRAKWREMTYHDKEWEQKEKVRRTEAFIAKREKEIEELECHLKN